MTPRQPTLADYKSLLELSRMIDKRIDLIQDQITALTEIVQLLTITTLGKRGGTIDPGNEKRPEATS